MLHVGVRDIKLNHFLFFSVPPLLSSRSHSTLTIYGISQDDEAIYQCIAENSAGSTQASARLTVLWADGLPGVATHVQAEALSPTTIQVSWREPDQNTQDIIGYVLHIRRTSGETALKIQTEKEKKNLQVLAAAKYLGAASYICKSVNVSTSISVNILHIKMGISCYTDMIKMDGTDIVSEGPVS